MADFRRQPEWQQNADRHSTLIDPVLTVRPIARFDYTARRPVTAIDHALVFATAGGAYDVYVPPHRPSRTDAATRRYTSVYEVDMGSHPVQLDLHLPSDDDAFAFGATADLTWRVVDPEAYVRSGERDVPTRLTRELQHLARPVTRRFPIEASPAAEGAVQQAVEGGQFAAGIGLAVTCLVRLRLDDEAIAHRRRQRALRYEAEMLDPEHEFRMRQAQQQHELEALRQRQQQELVAAKINFYQYHLQHGGVGAWALHLAAHPEDTQLVINNIHQDQLTFIKGQLELIGGEELEDYQKAESLKQVRQEVDNLIRARAQGALPAGSYGDSYGEQSPHVEQAPAAPGTPPAPYAPAAAASAPPAAAPVADGPAPATPPPPPAYTPTQPGVPTPPDPRWRS
ncbi:PE-PGRS family protein [Streptomyces cupreus]|uniref:PE-PGRS family protein n=1 Tax=Streptomyces cupreus TaxID=2759956 RepID=A0A7X1IZ77_9ACTN|nr:PE-PGRS family protein [Streptomyces cupreus]MBC2901233.1 PE-PGRS family protein [Streptomyces cupreus]